MSENKGIRIMFNIPAQSDRDKIISALVNSNYKVSYKCFVSEDPLKNDIHIIYVEGEEKKMSNEEQKLLPCPFCGSTELETCTGTEDREGVPTYISCGDCGATGPYEYEPVNGCDCKAKKAWNERKLK